MRFTILAMAVLLALATLYVTFFAANEFMSMMSTFTSAEQRLISSGLQLLSGVVLVAGVLVARRRKPGPE